MKQWEKQDFRKNGIYGGEYVNPDENPSSNVQKHGISRFTIWEMIAVEIQTTNHRNIPTSAIPKDKNETINYSPVNRYHTRYFLFAKSVIFVLKPK